MNNKFTMELVWHNCKTCPPKESYNPRLLVTDGAIIHEMIWDEAFEGFLKIGLEIRGDDLNKYWWADIRQTVQGEPRFKEKI